MYSAPGKRSTSKVMWCMVISVENPADLAMSAPSTVVMWHMLIADPLKLDARREIALVSAFAGRLRRWSLQQDSGPFDIRWSSSAWTDILRPVARTSLTAGINSSSSSRRMLPVVEPMNSLNPTTNGDSMRALIPDVTAAKSP